MSDISAEKVVPAKEPNVESGNMTAWKAGRQEKVIFGCLFVMCFYAAMESTGIGIALGHIALSTSANSVQAFWIGTTYLLAAAVGQPTFTSFSTVFGRRPICILAVMLFIIGTIVSSVSQNVPAILSGRTIQGLGAGGCLALTEILVTDLVPMRNRGNILGLLSAAWALGCAIAPLICGALVQRVTWRWIFWIILPFAVFTLVVLPFSMKLHKRPATVIQKVKAVDWAGCFLLLTSMTSFLVSISWGGVIFPWYSYRTLVPMILGLAGLVAFVAWEIYGVIEPLVPMHIFTNRTAATAYFQSFTTGLVLFTVVYYMPLYYQGVKGFSPFLSGVALLPEFLTVPPAAVFAGRLIQRVGTYRTILLVGWTIVLLGAGLLILLGLDTKTYAWILINMVGGIGTGIVLNPIRLAVQASASNKDQAFAAPMVVTMRYLGMAVSIAMNGSIFQNILRKNLQNTILSSEADALSTNAISLVELIQSLPSESPEKLVLRQAFAHAIRTIWIVCTGIVAVTWISSFFTKQLSLDRFLASEQGIKKAGMSDEEDGVEVGTVLPESLPN